MLSANVRPIDRARAGRLILAWLTDDRLALDTVIDEANAGSAGLAAMLFGVVDIAATVAVASFGVDNAVGQIRRALLVIAAGDDLDDDA